MLRRRTFWAWGALAAETRGGRNLGTGSVCAELASGRPSLKMPTLASRTGQRLAIYRNAKRLAKRSDIGLLAGARQRISDYGIYGYAMVSSRTLR